MSATLNSTHFDSLTPVQVEVLKALFEGLSITAAAQRAEVHRSTVHLWTRNHPHFAQALLTARQLRAEQLMDELAGLGQLACDTFRQLLTDPNTPAATRLKAAMELVKLVQSQRPNPADHLHAARASLEQRFVKATAAATHAITREQPPAPQDPQPIATPKQPVRNSPCPCGSRQKYKRCCGKLTTLAA